MCARETDDEPLGSSSTRDELLADLRVTLSVEMARRSVTVAELAAALEGSTIEMDMPVSRFVRLLAGGVYLADGELVDVGGRLGVRVISVLDSQEPIRIDKSSRKEVLA